MSQLDTPSKGTVKTTEIAIGGTKVKVRTDATPAFLKQVRDTVESKFQDMEDKLARGVSNHQLSLLVALNLAEELLQEREKLRQLKRSILERSERLINRVESHLNSQG